MKVTGICITNVAEIQKAVEMNLPHMSPEPIRGEYPLHFDKTRVESFYRTLDGDIMVHMYSGRFYAVKYDEAVWIELMKYTQ